MAVTTRPAQWSCTTVDDGAAAVIRPQGELDLVTVEEFRMTVDAAISAGVQVVVDLGRLTFVDSTALSYLLAAAERAREADVTLELLPGTASVMRLFEVTATVDVLPFRRSS